MAFAKEVQPEGDNNVYMLNPNLKKYTLMDLGFTTKKNGTYVLVRLLDTTSTRKQGIKFKMMVKSDLESFRISTVTKNEAQKVNIFKNNNESLREQYYFTIENLISRNVLIRK